MYFPHANIIDIKYHFKRCNSIELAFYIASHILAFNNNYQMHQVSNMLLLNGLQQQYLNYERETVVRRIACNNVRYTRLTSRYVEFCPPLGDVRDPDTLNLSARLKKSISYPLGVAEKTI